MVHIRFTSALLLIKQSIAFLMSGSSLHGETLVLISILTKTYKLGT